MKKTVSILVCMLLLSTLFGCAKQSPEGGTQLKNPMTDYTSFEELCAAAPSLSVKRPPEGASDIAYASIKGENQDDPVLQIIFTFNGGKYCYRSAALPKGEGGADFSGLYISWNHTTSITVGQHDYSILYTDKGEGLTTFADSTKTAHTLSISDVSNPVEALKAVLPALGAD